ncbi:MAG: SulP family inorganic anion transporter [Thermodesulfobacteriota bacterium]
MTGAGGSPRLFPVAVAGLVNGVRSVIVVISFATLIFSGRLSPFLSTGIGLALFSGAVFGVTMALLSSYRGAVGLPHSLPAAVTALVAAAAAGHVSAGQGPAAVFSTVAAALIITSLLTGTTFLVLGFFHLGDFIRYIPYPVIGGFVAGTGWLLVSGAFAVMVGDRLGLAGLPALFQPATLGYWLPGFCFGLLLFAVSKAKLHFSVLPALLVGGILVFYGGLQLAGLSLPQAMERGLLLGPFPETAGKLFLFYQLGPVDWGAVVQVLPDVGTIVILSTIALLLFASGIELAVGRRLDLDRELRAAGLANVLASLGGGLVGYHILSQTVLTHRLNAVSRWVGVISAACCGLTLLAGVSAVSYFPRAVLAGLVMFLGLDFLYEWLIKARSRLPAAEYYIVLVILVTIAGFGFLESIAAGVLTGLVLFVVNYSRVDVVQYAVTGAEYHSNVSRSEEETRILKETGPMMFILKLRGFLFFGTANNLLNQVRARAYNPDLPPLRYVLLDFRLVSGLDSSAVISFTRMKHLAGERKFILGLCSLPKKIIAQVQYGGFDFDEEQFTFLFPDLDHAMERCENHMLASAGRAEDAPAESLRERLAREFPSPAEVEALLGYFEKREVPAGEYLMHQGDDSRDLFFLESGRVTAELSVGDKGAVRLRTMGPGTVVGEIGVYTGLTRTASVKADRDCTVLRLTGEKMKLMQARDPAAAAAFHHFMVRLLAGRLADTNEMLRAVLE